MSKIRLLRPVLFEKCKSHNFGQILPLISSRNLLKMGKGYKNELYKKWMHQICFISFLISEIYICSTFKHKNCKLYLLIWKNFWKKSIFTGFEIPWNLAKKATFWRQRRRYALGSFWPCKFGKKSKCRQSLYIANFMVPIYRPGKMYTNLTVLMTHFWWWRHQISCKMRKMEDLSEYWAIPATFWVR